MPANPDFFIMLEHHNYRVTAVPAFSDNYLWLIDNGEQAIAVDPGDAKPVLQALKTLNLELAGIWITHHHADHIGGINELLNLNPVSVYGPKSVNIPQITEPLAHNSQLSVLGLDARVIAVPGHTLDHITYFIDTPNPLNLPLLFSGDTLFAGGCGRVFEGSYEQMCQSLKQLMPLPSATQIFCAHEYTTANLAFAQAVEPDNEALQKRIAQVAALRSKNIPTVPSTLDEELSTNPFLRFGEASVIASATQRDTLRNTNEENVFASIRRWKDEF
jgi:hydroxyacylglutathione hydrolase